MARDRMACAPILIWGYNLIPALQLLVPWLLHLGKAVSRLGFSLSSVPRYYEKLQTVVRKLLRV